MIASCRSRVFVFGIAGAIPNTGITIESSSVPTKNLWVANSKLLPISGRFLLHRVSRNQNMNEVR
jgi:hypothetical protein